MRELTANEIDAVSGGIKPLIVIAALTLYGAAFKGAYEVGRAEKQDAQSGN